MGCPTGALITPDVEVPAVPHRPEELSCASHVGEDSASLGHNKKPLTRDSEIAAKPVFRPTRALFTLDVEVSTGSPRSEELSCALHAGEDSMSVMGGST